MADAIVTIKLSTAELALVQRALRVHSDACKADYQGAASKEKQWITAELESLRKVREALGG